MKRGVIDMRKLIGFFRDRSGATSIEYAILASGIALLIIAAVNNLGSAVKTEFTSVSTALK
jgi:pilus assembly protein Flp/PilA